MFRKRRLFIQHFAFMRRNEIRARHGMMQFEAVVLGLEVGGVLLVASHNLYRVEIDEIDPEDFYRLYEPDLASTPARVAKELRSHYRTMMVAVPPVTEYVENLLADPPTLEDLPMTKKPKAPTAKKTQFVAGVYTTTDRRTCILVERNEETARFIPMFNEEGAELQELRVEEFDQIYNRHLADYPVEKAAQLYAEYARNLGATAEVMRRLADLTSTITEKDIQMATAKKTAAAKAAPAKKAAPAAKKTAAKTAPAKAEKNAKPAAKKADGEKRESAAQLFQDLIMDGKLTDDQIFKRVQDKYGLDDKKRSYVAWYRNHLTKQGKNPPAAKA